ncbi:MAG: class I SAM-dependent methyltransferase [Chitinispirillaceae bacterium]|nr:class I SAM-dependent methyltransferase [Chitinispirillaceae bacterium]
MSNNLIARAFRKLIIEPLKYGKRNDYDAKKYWHDRFNKYGDAIQGPGNEALTEEENWKMYEEAKEVFINLCRKEQINFETSSFCEIGLGNGFYTKILKDLGVTKYKGFDISDVLIPRMRERFPGYSFEENDIGSEELTGHYDVITLIDVIQHIVNEDKCNFALSNIARHLNVGGTFFIGPLTETSKRPLFYLHGWTIEKIKTIFKDPYFSVSSPIEFRNGYLTTIKKISEPTL